MSSLWWGLVLKDKILKYSSLMRCMYVPVSIRKCLACVFSMFHVKTKENGSCYSHFWRWGEIQAFILLPVLCCCFYPQSTVKQGCLAIPALTTDYCHTSPRSRALREAVEFRFQCTVPRIHSSLLFQ